MERDLEEEWVINIDDELENSSTTEMDQQFWRKRSIYRSPASITDPNNKAYKPQVVSFGPYHHGQPHLQKMEEQKQRVLLRVLKRSNKPLKAYIDSLAPVVQDLKDSYDSLDAAWQQDTNAFLKLMILDGCFMLEILRVAYNFSHNVDVDNDYPINDPIFSYHAQQYIMSYFKRDMLLLENQLPMLVLNKMFASQYGVEPEDYPIGTIELIGSFCLRHGTWVPNFHVLDVYRESILFQPPPPLPPYLWFQPAYNKRSATELNKAGIRFRKAKSGSLKDISFDNKGVLTLPVVIVDDAAESVFLNLIAFERFHIGAGTDVTSYLYLFHEDYD